MSTAAITAPPRLSPFLDPNHHLLPDFLSFYQRRLARPTTRLARVCARDLQSVQIEGEQVLVQRYPNETPRTSRRLVDPARARRKSNPLSSSRPSRLRSVFRITRLTVPLTFLLLVSLIYFHSNNKIISSVESCENLSFVPGRYCRTKREEEYIQ